MWISKGATFGMIMDIKSYHTFLACPCFNIKQPCVYQTNIKANNCNSYSKVEANSNKANKRRLIGNPLMNNPLMNKRAYANFL